MGACPSIAPRRSRRRSSRKVRSGGCSGLSSHGSWTPSACSGGRTAELYVPGVAALSGMAEPFRIEVGAQVRAEVNCPGMSRGARLTAHSAVSTSLALRSDRALGELVDTAVPAGSGIGGKPALLEIAGTPVFMKRVPLTDTERRLENARSTANVFALPVFCQYGIGSPGFGAWRELAVHTMTTNWVLAGDYEGFPLMYHWRVLPDSPPEGFADEFGGIDG